MDIQYKQLIQSVLKDGSIKKDRTGVGTISLFDYNMKFDLRQGFPIQTTKKIHFKSVKGELLWMISGSTSAKELRDVYGVTIWDEWQNADGSLGKIYGHQWTNWNDQQINQLNNAVELIKTNPDDRGIIVNAWNVGQLSEMNLRPCHTMFQFYVSDGHLDLKLYQRSGDVFLGIPYNISSYSLLLSLVAKLTDLKPRYFCHSIGDAHIYKNHLDQCNEVLLRDCYNLPQLDISSKKSSLNEYKPEDIILLNYKSHPKITAQVAK